MYQTYNQMEYWELTDWVYCDSSMDASATMLLIMSCILETWLRHQMETFSASLAICAVNCGEFPTQRPVTRSFDVFLDLRLNKRLSKQSCGWWFETLSCPLWRHRNESCQVALRSRQTTFQRSVTIWWPTSHISYAVTFQWSIIYSRGQPSHVKKKLELWALTVSLRLAYR